MDARDRELAAAPPWVRRSPGKARRTLRPEDVIRTALRLVDTRGFEAFSIRGLAGELGVATSAVYWHVGGRESVLLAVVDAAFEEIRLPRATKGQWRRQLERLSCAMREAILRHPEIHPILANYLIVSPHALRATDRALAVLSEAGLEGAELVHAYNAWSGYVVGFTLVEVKPQSAEDGDGVDQKRRYLGALPKQEFPEIVRRMPALGNRAYLLRWNAEPLGQRGGSFGYGLDLLLDGLERKASARGARRAGDRIDGTA